VRTRADSARVGQLKLIKKPRANILWERRAGLRHLTRLSYEKWYPCDDL